MDCEKCGSTDVFESNERLNLQEEWAECTMNCNECGAMFHVCMTVIIDKLEEIL